MDHWTTSTELGFRVRGSGFEGLGSGIGVRGLGFIQSTPPSAFVSEAQGSAPPSILTRPERHPGGATQGPLWGYSNVNSERFSRKRWRFSPNVDKNVHERPPDTPTKGLLWHHPGAVERAGNNLEDFKDFRTKTGSSPGHDLALTVLYLQSSLDRGFARA